MSMIFSQAARGNEHNQFYTENATDLFTTTEGIEIKALIFEEDGEYNIYFIYEDYLYQLVGHNREQLIKIIEGLCVR